MSCYDPDRLRRAIQFVLVLLLTGMYSPGQAQEQSVVIQRDVRLFTVISALNAAGFDVELARQYHPVRQQVREHLAGLDPGLLVRLREFYLLRRGEVADDVQSAREDDQLAKYVSLALNLSDPPRMVLLRNDDFLPEDAALVVGFVPLLNEFFDTAGLARLWSSLEGAYDVELDRLAAPLRDMIVGSDVYLKVPAGASAQRQLIISVELTAPVNSVNIRNYPDNLYMVLGSVTSDATRDVRHAYLHLLLDPLVASAGDLAKAESLLSLTDGAEGVVAEYASDSRILVGESLIRAVELRMDGVEEADAAAGIDQMYRQGLLLAPYFYAALKDYEMSETGIREYLPVMVEALAVDDEVARFDERFHSIERTVEIRPRAEVPAPRDPVNDLLVGAQELFNAGDNAAAAIEFRRVVDEFDPDNGAALYGLALIASREQDAETARDLFIRAIQSETIEGPMKIWSHVYLGRIYDIDCDRRRALEQYRLALDTDQAGSARTAAEEGLQAPFAGGCALR